MAAPTARTCGCPPGKFGKKKAALLQKALDEKQQARLAAQETRNQILADKKALKAAIAALKRTKKEVTAQNQTLHEQITTLTARKKKLVAALDEMDAVTRELVGFVRTNARDLDTLLRQSQQSALLPGRRDGLTGLIKQTVFPGMADVRRMTELYFDEIQRSGEVRLVHGPMVDRAGTDTLAEILILGNFTAAYRNGKETGFLLYSDASERLFALSKLPPSRIAANLKNYMAGKSESVYMDVSRGAALRQLTHRLSLADQVKNGGPIVWPILGVAVLAGLIVLERLIFLSRKNMNADSLMKQLNAPALGRDWDACGSLCDPCRHKPVSKVLLQGIKARCTTREDMENVLQEAILREIPRLERFLSTLGMLAGIAPLLGLLGTVTGMINTFHVITYFGTGDPRMMSGGISEALVTTMLGLAVAIPIMLCHTFLNRRVENMIAQMEEKSVTFINTLFKGPRAK